VKVNVDSIKTEAYSKLINMKLKLISGVLLKFPHCRVQGVREGKLWWTEVV
jgi:hypothetical protein